MEIQRNAIRATSMTGIMGITSMKMASFTVFFAVAGIFLSRSVWAVSYTQALGKVVAADSRGIVIEVSKEGRAIQFVLKNSDRSGFQYSLKKGDRVKVWYSLELKKVDRIDSHGETRILVPLEGFEESPEMHFRIDDRAFYES